MRTIWHVGCDGPVCSWCPSEDEGWQELGPQDLGLIDEEEEAQAGSFRPGHPDYATHSLLGSGEWYAPWDMRWSLPSRW